MASRAPHQPTHRIPAEIPGWRKLTAKEIRALPSARTPTGKPATGKERFYQSTAGQIITRRTYVDKQAKVLGYESWSEYQRFSKYAGDLGGMRSEAALELVSSMNRAQAAGELDAADRDKFIRNHADIIREVKAHPDDMSAHGPMAHWLEALGVREQNAAYDVGDSPHGMRQTLGR